MGKIASSSSFLILKEDTLLHQSPHEMSPSLSEYHIATLGSDDDCDDVYDGMMVMMMYTMMIVMMVMIMLFSNIRLTVSETLAD